MVQREYLAKMKNLFDAGVTDEIITRIEKLAPDSTGRWGKMDVAQMLSHCGNALEMAMGMINPPRVLIGKLIGGFFKSSYTNEKPFSKDSPTSEEIIVKGFRDVQKGKGPFAQLDNEIFPGEGNGSHHKSASVLWQSDARRMEQGDVQTPGSPSPSVWRLTRNKQI